jgi:hypothetical protein
MTTHDEYATWDAAYVLGALAPAERREYEEHLRACERCSDTVGELAGMPGLLSRVPQEQAFALLGPADAAVPQAVGAPEGPADTVLPSLLHRARRRRARTRWLVAGLSAAAAAVLVGVLAFLLPAALPQPQDEAGRVTMRQVEPSAVTADLRLTSEPWGTRIESRCKYAHVGDDEGYHRAWTYAMVVTDRAGRQTAISTWTAQEGTTAWPTATTSVRLADIAAVDIRTAGDGTVLLRSTFD